jgi:hypothetical protein
MLSYVLPAVFCASHLVYSATLRPAAAASTLPSLFAIAASLLRLCHYFCTPHRERYTFALPLSAALLLVYEFSALSAQLERQGGSRAAAAAASPSAAATRLRDLDPRRSGRRLERTILDLRPEDAWRWTDLPSYLLCTGGGAVLLLLLSSLLLPRPPRWYLLGLSAAAAGCEAAQCAPRLRAALAAASSGQRGSYLGLLAAAAAAAALGLLPRGAPPALLRLAPCAALACEAAVVACAELPLLGLGAARGGSGRAAKAV